MEYFIWPLGFCILANVVFYFEFACNLKRVCVCTLYAPCTFIIAVAFEDNYTNLKRTQKKKTNNSCHYAIESMSNISSSFVQEYRSAMPLPAVLICLSFNMNLTRYHISKGDFNTIFFFIWFHSYGCSRLRIYIYTVQMIILMHDPKLCATQTKNTAKHNSSVWKKLGRFFFFFRNAKLREFRVFQMFSFAPIWDFEFIASIVTLSTFYSWMRKILSQISDSYFAIILIQNSRNVSLNDVSQILWDAVFGSTIMVKYSLSNFSVHNK